MPLESATVIPQLDPDNPLGSDPISNGDNHVRLIKSVLVNQLGSLGAGLLSVTAEQINTAAASAGQYATGTSTTSLLIGLGAKAFTTQPNRAFGVGQKIRLTSQANIANYMVGTCSAYDSTTGAMSVTVDTIGGSGTYADWSVVVFIPDPSTKINRSARTANTAITTTDNSTWVDITANSFTQTFDSTSVLGAGFWCILGNSGTGDITIDPSGAETIDGLSSYIMYPGEVRLVQCDGSALRTVVWAAFSKTFTATGGFVKPPGYLWFEGEAISGGGSGGKSGSTAFNTGGGGGGSCFPFRLQASQVSAAETVNIGAGGAAQAGVADGAVGGNTTFGSLIIAYGGGPGGGSAANRPGGGGGGIASVGLVTGVGGSPCNSTLGVATKDNQGFGGGHGVAGYTATAGFSVYGGGGGGDGNNGAGGSSIYGGGGGGGAQVAGQVAAGTSKMAGNGGAGSVTGVGVAGSAPGGGGGATCTGANSGAGARGELRIRGEI